jgi:hypothetical protein
LRKLSTLSGPVKNPSRHLRYQTHHSHGLKAVPMLHSHGLKAVPSSRNLRKNPLQAIKKHPMHHSRMNGSKSKKIETSGHYKREVITTIDEIASYIA